MSPAIQIARARAVDESSDLMRTSANVPRWSKQVTVAAVM
jgi:hypothetical protein